MQSFKTALKWIALGVSGLVIVYAIQKPATFEITYSDNVDKLISVQVIEKPATVSVTRDITNADKPTSDEVKFIVICNDGTIVPPNGRLTDNPSPCSVQSRTDTRSSYPQIIRPKFKHSDSNIYHTLRVQKSKDGRTHLFLEEPQADPASSDTLIRAEDMVVMPVEAGFFCDRLEKDLDEHSDRELYDIVTSEKAKYPAIYGKIDFNPSDLAIEFEATLARLNCLHRESQILNGLPVLESPTSSPVYLRPTDVHLVVRRHPPPPTWIIVGSIVIWLLVLIGIVAAALAIIRKLRLMSSLANG